MIGKKHRARPARTAGNSPPEPEPAAAVAAGSRGFRGISEARTLSRRRLLEGGAALAGLTLAGEVFAASVGGGATAASITPPALAGAGGKERARHAFDARVAAARLQDGQPPARHATNGDETGLAGGIACYSKGLPHDPLGMVDAAAYRLLLQALASGRPADFERIPLGGFVRLANPDASAGLEMGERLAVAVLREMKLTGNELFSGFSLRRFDGGRVTI